MKLRDINANPGLASVNAVSAELRAATDMLDRHQFKRLHGDLVTMMQRHGRGRILGIVIDALRDSEGEGAKW